MQTAPSLNLAFLGIPGLFIGLIIGYILGEIDSISAGYRILLGLFVNVVVGLILALFISVTFYMMGSLEIVFIVLSLLGGFGLGLFLNWKPYFNTSRKNHIIYDPEDDDEEFERQIKEALGDNE